MKKCPQCGRTDDDLGHCGSMVTCPMIAGQPASDVHPTKDIILHCDPCGFTRVVPVAKLTHNKPPELDVQCPRGEDCACVTLRPTAPEAQPTPPGLIDAMRQPQKAGGKRGA